MSQAQKKYRFLFIAPFHMPQNARFTPYSTGKTKEEQLVHYERLKPLLEDVDWDYDDGPLSPYGDWPVETREEFCLVAAARLPIVRKACESGKYNAIVLLGGGEPGFTEAREIATGYKIPVTSFAYAQLHIAAMLGNKFSIIDIAENHNMYYYNLVVQHQLTNKCASIRNINLPLPRPGHEGEINIIDEQKKAQRGEPSVALERALKEAVAAVQEDSAEVITFGCASTFWLKPYVEKHFKDLGWDIPVLEGYSSAISLAKLMIDIGIHASGLMFPSPRTTYSRVKKF
jgi:allantoin racemase